MTGKNEHCGFSNHGYIYIPDHAILENFDNFIIWKTGDYIITAMINIEVLDNAGLVYKKNDVDDLVRCLQAVSDRPQDYAGLAAAALDRARTQYSWANVIQKYEQLFIRLVANSKR